MTRRWLLPLLILSGFAGLAYELLWVRLLTFSLGSTTTSFSTVLAVFFGGLAAGSRWAGKRSLATRAPLRAYALLELATGGLGLLLYPVLVSLGPLIARLDPGDGGGGLALRLVVATVVLLPPSFLMGATLPFVTVASVKSDAESGRGVSLIYGFNTLGACVGAYTITFQLLPNLGILRSTLVVVAVNVVVGAVTLLMAKRRGDGRVAEPTEATTADKPAAPPLDPKVRFAVLLATLIGGFAATGAQIVWARTFAILLGGTTYGIGSVLVSVLVGIALGSLLAASVMTRTSHAPLAAAAIQGGVLMGIIIFILGVPLASYLVGLLPTAGLSGDGLHHGDLGVAVLVLAAPTIASGASMPALIGVLGRSAATAGDTLSRVYTANTVGCIAGSLLVGLVLLPMLGSASILYVLFLLLTIALCVFVVATCRERPLPAFGLVALALVGAGLFPALDAEALLPRVAHTIDYFTHTRQLAQAKQSRVSNYEGDVATVRVTRTEFGKGLALNGLGQGSRSEVAPDIAFESTLVATIPWQHAPRHDRGLVVGLGAGGTVRKFLQLGVGALEVAELEKGVVSAVADIWGDENPLLDARVKLVNDDARSYLLSTSYKAPHSYDFITSMPAHPWVASALFTTEFFELAKANLKTEGVFATWFGPGNMPETSIEALFGAFTSVFPSWFVYWVPEAGAFYLVGSSTPLAFDVPAIAGLENHLVYSGIDRAQVTPVAFAARLVAQSAKGGSHAASQHR
jgi:spermidine synthase